MSSKFDPDRHDETVIDDRCAAVLKAVIREHVVTGEPIGSKTVSRGTRLDLSPASIRNIMAELEERGLLSQPHTSAGRIPTDRAYRVYVDHLLGPARMAEAEAQAIERAMSGSNGEFADLLSEASRQLSRLSNQVGVVLAPELRRIIVDRLEFVRLDGGRVVVILVGRSGVVHNRVLHVADPPEQHELDRIGRYLSGEFGGRTVPEMRERLQQRMSEERARYDALMAESLAWGRRAVAAEDLDAAVFVEGTSNLVGEPEFADLAVMRSLFKTLEEKKTLIGLLSRVIDGEGVQVVIGDENPASDLARCSVVASSYGTGDRVMGTVGIVGPTRMAYAHTIALVDHLAKVLTRILSTDGN